MVTNNEEILCAAVWFRDIENKIQDLDTKGNHTGWRFLSDPDIPSNFRLPTNCDKGLVFCGYRHLQCLHTMISATGLTTSEVGEYIFGFLTNCNRFVDRAEGGRIHRANGHSTQLSDLFSEDLY